MNINLLDFIDNSKTAFHAVEYSAAILEREGFKRLDFNESWQLFKGGAYYIDYDSAIIAFKIFDLESGFNIIASHTDSPAIIIKPAAVINNNSYIKLNTEVYGGAILNTWFDRPLSMAGRAVLKTDDILNPATFNIDFERAVSIIPNLAIHLNREINKGHDIDRQKELLPIVGMSNERLIDEYLLEMIAKKLECDKSDILSFELFLYDNQKSQVIGFENEFINAPRLDNLAMLYASLDAICNTKKGRGISLMVGFDNEEIGSATRFGADSTILRDAVERILLSFNIDKEKQKILFNKSFAISADAAHAYHPNYPEKYDLTNKAILNKGPVIKMSANKRYTTDSYTQAVFSSICQKEAVPYQIFVNHSSSIGGSTIGPILSTQLSIKSIDVGIPMLSMHSIRELIGTKDIEYIIKVFRAFYSL